MVWKIIDCIASLTSSKFSQFISISLSCSLQQTHPTTVISAWVMLTTTRRPEPLRSSSLVQSAEDQVRDWKYNFVQLKQLCFRSPHLSPVHWEHADQCQEISLAVHRVQDLHPVWNQREWRQAAVLWRLRQRIPHVLSGAPHEGNSEVVLTQIIIIFISISHRWLLRGPGAVRSVWRLSTKSKSAKDETKLNYLHLLSINLPKYDLIQCTNIYSKTAVDTLYIYDGV